MSVKILFYIFSKTHKERVYILHIMAHHSHMCRVQKPKNYRTIRSECLKGGKLFLDDQFPLLDKSIFVLNEKSKQNTIKWIRAKDLYQNPLFFNDEFIKNDLENTKFGILFFLASLFIITTV